MERCFDLKQVLMDCLRTQFSIVVHDEKPSEKVAESFYLPEPLRLYEQQVGDFLRANYEFIIQYTPRGIYPNRECREMIRKLVKALQFLGEVKLKPLSMEAEVINGILEFRTHFNLRYTVEEETGPVFSGLDLQTSMKQL